jgi:imidazolonepropionase-like amidohydrolase
VNSIEHAYQVADSTLALMARKNVVMVPTDIDSVTLALLLARQAAKHNLSAYAASGMPNTQVLQAATINAARLIGPRSRIGVVKGGMFADIIAVDGDPVASIGALDRIVFVMANGRVHRAAP